VLDQFPLLNP